MENDKKKSLNTEILKNIQITSQEHMLIKSIEDSYKKNNNMIFMLPIIRGESNISMRLIDYFVTNYAKKYRVCYYLEENGVKILFNVYASYKSQLKAYNKKYFDPFSRGNRIPFFFSDDCIITTIGQLNFFRWFISKKILNYVQKNLEIIELELNKNKNQSKKQNKSKVSKYKKIKKPSYLSQNKINYPINQINLQLQPKKPTKIRVTFD